MSKNLTEGQLVDLIYRIYYKYFIYKKGLTLSRRNRKPEKKIYRYECSLTGEKYKMTEKAEHPDDLMSVKAYYQMHPDDDDRPLVVKKQLGLEEPTE